VSIPLAIRLTCPPAYRLGLINLLALEMLPLYPSQANAVWIDAQASIAMDRIRAINVENLMVEATLDSRVYGNSSNREWFWNGS